MKIEIGINWPLASELPATAVPASCCSGCLHPERPLADVGWRVLKQFSHARLWRKKTRFLADFPSNHLNHQSPFVCADRRLHFCAELRIDFLGARKPRGIEWQILADHGGPNCSLFNPDKALAMHKEIWTERRTLIFYTESVWHLSLVHNLPVFSYLSWPFSARWKCKHTNIIFLGFLRTESFRWNQGNWPKAHVP